MQQLLILYKFKGLFFAGCLKLYSNVLAENFQFSIIFIYLYADLFFSRRLMQSKNGSNHPEPLLMAMRYPLLSNGILGTSLSITRVSILHIPTCTCTRRSNAMLELTVPTMHSVQLNHASTCATCSGERWRTGYCNNRVVKCKELVRNVF